MILTGDFNMNFVDFGKKKVRRFLNLIIFLYDMTNLTNKPTRIT